MTYRITAEVNQTWFDILGQITQHQDGFVWLAVSSTDGRVLREADNGELFLGDE